MLGAAAGEGVNTQLPGDRHSCQIISGRDNWQGNKMIVLITQLRDCLISTVSLEYLRASQRWSRDGVNGKEKALTKDAVTKREIKKPFILHKCSVLRLSFSRVAGTFATHAFKASKSEMPLKHAYHNIPHATTGTMPA